MRTSYNLAKPGRWWVDALAPCQCAMDRLATCSLPSPACAIGSADDDNRAESGISVDIPQRHGDVYRRFVDLWNLRASSGDKGTCDAAWQKVANLLEVHAIAESEHRSGLPAGA